MARKKQEGPEDFETRDRVRVTYEGTHQSEFAGK